MKIYDEQGLRDALDNLDKAKPEDEPERRGVWWRTYGLVGSSLVTASAAFVHVASYFTVLSESNVLILMLALPCMASFGAMLAASRFGHRTRALLKSTDPRAILRTALEENRRAASLVPAYAKLFLVATVLYLAVNFLVFLAATIEGTPRKANGEHYLVRRGQTVRTLSAEEFRRLRMWEFRGATGHLIIFSMVAALGFLYVVEKPKPAGDDGGAR